MAYELDPQTFLNKIRDFVVSRFYGFVFLRLRGVTVARFCGFEMLRLRVSRFRGVAVANELRNLP